jgi:hypothetical protein
MPNFIATPTYLPSEQQVWYGSALPSLSTDVAGMNLKLGDLVQITSASAGMGYVYKLIGLPSTTYPGGAWQKIAGYSSKPTSVSAAYTVNGNTDDFVLMTGANAFQVTLCDATVYSGKSITIMREGGGNGTVVCQSGQNLGNSHTTITFNSDESAVALISDGTQWHVANASTSKSSGTAPTSS